MKTFYFIYFWFVVLSFIYHVCSYKILCAYPTISPSHYLVVEKLMIGLAEKGHDVTVFTKTVAETNMSNYREILIEEDKKTIVPLFRKHTGKLWNLYQSMPVIMDVATRGIELLLQNAKVQKIMDEESFDLVIMEAVLGNAMVGLGAHFKCPIISFTSFIPMYTIHKLQKDPLAISYVPNPSTSFILPMSFYDRAVNMFLYLSDVLFLDRVEYAKHRQSYDKHFKPPHYPSYDEMMQNISLSFICSHYTQGSPRPLLPNVVEISGIHIPSKSTPLPDDLQRWMDNSTNGVILFSLGTNMRSAFLPLDTLNNIMYAFSKLKWNILWKLEDTTLGLNVPENVRIGKWLPQNEILRHRNTKLFISHGGLGSVMEAKYHGVPLIVTPIFGDQMGNAFAVESRGLGIQFPFDDMNGEILTKSINEVLLNPRYAEKAKQDSIIYRDRQNTPLETAIFWVEYVIRHRGAKHLHSNARHLNFFQLHSLDVLGFLATIVLVVLFIFYKIAMCVLIKMYKFTNKSKCE